MTPPTLWKPDFAGTTGLAKRQVLKLFPSERVFDTPKPEELLRRIIEIATNPGDLVLDAYLGSGDHRGCREKLGRRWIGIEQGDHAATLCAERVRAVVDGESGGISEAVDWTGGGGFRFYRCNVPMQRAA